MKHLETSILTLMGGYNGLTLVVTDGAEYKQIIDRDYLN